MVAENVGVVRASETKSESEQACGLSVVLPCLNEAETLATCITKAQQSIEGPWSRRRGRRRRQRQH